MGDILDKRSYVKLKIGDYVLKADTYISFLVAHREDGTPTPKPLLGRWTDSESFRKAALAFHGDEYSQESLRAKSLSEAEASEAEATEGE